MVPLVDGKTPDSICELLWLDNVGFRRFHCRNICRDINCDGGMRLVICDGHVAPRVSALPLRSPRGGFNAAKCLVAGEACFECGVSKDGTGVPYMNPLEEALRVHKAFALELL